MDFTDRLRGCALVWVGGRLGVAEIQPVFLVGEADGHEEDSKAEGAGDAVALAEIAHVVEEGLADGEDKQEESLPANEGAALPEADGEQGGSVEHEEGGDGEGLLQVGFEVAGGGTPDGIELADAGEDGDEIEGDDGGPGDGAPGGGGFIGILVGVEGDPRCGGEGCDAGERGGETAVEEGSLDGMVEPEGEGEEAAEAEREGCDGKPAEDAVGACWSVGWGVGWGAGWDAGWDAGWGGG